MANHKLSHRQFRLSLPLSGVLLLLLATFAFFQPVRIHVDVSRWMSEAALMATGMLPYRDFSWAYPPLGIFVAGGWAELFGSTLASYGAMIWALSAIIALLLGHVLFQITESRAWAGGGTLAAVLSALASEHTRLFSFGLYTPSALVATIGTLLVVTGLIGAWKGAGNRYLWVAAIGLIICFLTKVEAAAGALAVAAVYSVLQLQKPNCGYGAKLSSLAQLWIPSVGVAVAAYVFLGRLVGARNLMDGLSGYHVLPSEISRINLAYFAFANAVVFVWLFVAAGFVFAILDHDGVLRRCHRLLWNTGRLAGIVGLVGVTGFILVDDRASFRMLSEGILWAPRWIAAFVVVAAGLAYFRNRALFLRKYSDLVPVILFSTLVVFDYSRSFLWVRHYSVVLPIGVMLLVVLAARTLRDRRLLNVPASRSKMKWLVAAIGFIALAPLLLPRSSVQLETVQGRFRVYPETADVLGPAISYLTARQDPPSSITSCPSSGFSYLLGRQAPLPQTQCTRWIIRPEAMERLITAFEEAKPAFHVSISQDSPLLRESYSRHQYPALWQYIDANYAIDTIFASADSVLIVRIYKRVASTDQ